MEMGSWGVACPCSGATCGLGDVWGRSKYISFTRHLAGSFDERCLVSHQHLDGGLVGRLEGRDAEASTGAELDN